MSVLTGRGLGRSEVLGVTGFLPTVFGVASSARGEGHRCCGGCVEAAGWLLLGRPVGVLWPGFPTLFWLLREGAEAVANDLLPGSGIEHGV